MKNTYATLSKPELAKLLHALETEVEHVKAQKLSLDMARGKPSKEQVALSRVLLDVLTSQSDLVQEGQDAANYGSPWGLSAARRLAAQISDVPEAGVLVMGSSSVNLMFDALTVGYIKGFSDQKPWSAYPPKHLKFVCPSPGYDRHFSASDHLGFRNIPIPMTPEGPDMDRVEELVEQDETVKGIWCVPVYSNPTGVIYSDEVIRRFAALRPKASDFRIFWDNAYCVHSFAEDVPRISSLIQLQHEQGISNRAFVFGSTAKITFPSSGLSWIYADPQDLEVLKASFMMRRVSPEKLSQLAHIRFFADKAAVLQHMKQHAQLLAPKFQLVEKLLSAELGELGIATWTQPKGGYFVSFDGIPGSAKAIVALAREMGVTLTPAGATYPYGMDPRDTNIRLAPTCVSEADLLRALKIFALAVKVVSARLVYEQLA